MNSEKQSKLFGQSFTKAASSDQLELDIEKSASLLERYDDRPAFLVDELFSVVVLTSPARMLLGIDFEAGTPLFDSRLAVSDELPRLTSEIRSALTQSSSEQPRFLRIEIGEAHERRAYCLTLEKARLSDGHGCVICVAEPLASPRRASQANAFTQQPASHSVAWSLRIDSKVFERFDEGTPLNGREIGFYDWLESVHEPDREPLKAAFERLFEGADTTLSARYRSRLPSGDLQNSTTLARIAPAPKGQESQVILGLHSYEPDQQNVVDDLKLFSHLARKVQLSILVYDESGYVNWCNNAFTESTGYSYEEAVGRDPIALLRGPLTELETVKYMRDRIRRGKAFHAELVQYKKSGAPYWVRIDGTPLMGDDGKVNRFISFQTDITENKKTQNAILRNEIKFRSLFDNSNDALLLVSPKDGVIVEANRASIQLLDTDRLVGQRLAEIFPDNPTFTIENLNTVVTDRTSERRQSSEIVASNGQIKPVELTVSHTPIGDSMALFVTLRDISEKRLLEEQLRHAQRMEAVGRLAGGIAHDFNNLLAGQRGFSELLCNSSELTKKDHLYATEILKITDRASKLTSRLLSFSRGKSEKPVVANLNETVSNLMPMLSRILKKEIRFTSKLDPELCNVRVDTNQVDQVIMNLVVNGQEAISSHEGVVSLRTAMVELNGSEIFITGKPKPGRYARVSVRDNGQGIPRDVLEKIFEPFFTTKKGAGTGLGLSIVYGIIQSNGGHLSVDSQVGAGTEFAFYFPEVKEAVTPQELTDHRKRLPSALSSESGDTPTILVAEDQEQVREILELGLGQSGYNLIIAKDGMEAIEKGKAFEGTIDLLLTDSIMPKASGVRVVKAMRERYPNIKVILVSGLPQQDSAECKDLDVDAYVDKPFSIRKLLELINDLVGVPE